MLLLWLLASAAAAQQASEADVDQLIEDVFADRTPFALITTRPPARTPRETMPPRSVVWLEKQNKKMERQLKEAEKLTSKTKERVRC